MNITYISWAPHCSRSDHTARELGGTSHMVYWSRLGSRPSTIWLKYLGQAVRTWWILLRERPRVVFVMTPPVVAVLSVWAYCRLARARYVVDAHTAAFLDPRWAAFQKLQYWYCRRAVTTLVTNQHLRERLEAHGAHATVVPDVPAKFAGGASYGLGGGFNVAVVCSFNPDEPIAEIVRATAFVPDVRFYLTGGGAARAELADLPPNVASTGFLPVPMYGALLRAADAVMTLTTRDHTMLRGAWEAIYQGTPVIVSDWPTLREAFDQGAVHVENHAEAIADGVRTMQAQHTRLRVEAEALRQRKEVRWQATRESLLARLGLA